MTFPFPGRIASTFIIATTFLALTACGKATPPYEFTATTTNIAMGAGTVEVRLKKTSSGAFVEDAVIAATRLDMKPDGMGDMTSLIEPQGSSGPGAYRFSANFKMAGDWQLSLTARVPGEAQPVQGTVNFHVE